MTGVQTCALPISKKDGCEDVKHTINWFEIPATNVKRAAKFYSAVLEIKMEEHADGPCKMAVFPAGNGSEERAIHGALVQSEWHKPSSTGVLVYLNGNPDLAVPLAKVSQAGGKVVMQKTAIGEHGFMAAFIDTEGNRVALHSMK